MKLRDLKSWLATLPPEADEAEVMTMGHYIPHTTKRVMLVGLKGDNEAAHALIIQPMGVHTSAEFDAEVVRLSSYSGPALPPIMMVSQP